MHCAAIVEISCSAITEAGAALPGKYAKKRGCCQWVMPGRDIYKDLWGLYFFGLRLIMFRQ